MRRLTLGALIAALVSAGGCGSSGSKRLSKEEFARRADVACARYQREIASLATPHTVQQFAVFAESTISALDRAEVSVRKLRPPKDEQPLARRWFTLLSRLRIDATKLRDRARANDLGGVQRVAAAAKLDDRAYSRLSTRLGMKVCNAAD